MGNSCSSNKNSHQRKFSRIESYSTAWARFGFFDILHIFDVCSEIKLGPYESRQHFYRSFWHEIQIEIQNSSDNLRTKNLKKLVRQ